MSDCFLSAAGRCVFLALFAVLPGIALAQTAAASPDPAASSAPASQDPFAECALCHPDAVQKMKSSRHGVAGDARTPWGTGKLCIDCHGDPGEHAQNPVEKKPAVVFNKTMLAKDKSAPCMTCHQGGNRMHWQGGAHDRSEIACNDCHTMHGIRDQVRVQATQAGVCFECHKDIRSQMMRVSAHPLKEGQMACTSCHQPHGTESDRLMLKDTINDTCYICHAEKRGPFLWEHPPVRDSCVNCHSPHGTNNRPLLLSRRPQLCQSCHMPNYHPSVKYDGSGLPPNPGSDKMLNYSCQNCHTKIHGSNHPSGPNLTR